MTTVSPCRKCGGDRHWCGTRWLCRPCQAASWRAWKASRTPEQLESDKRRANDLRNARRAADPAKRAADYARTAAWRITNADRYRAGARRWYADNADRARSAKLAEYYAAPEKFYARNLVRKARLRDAVCEHGSDCVSSDFLARCYSSVCVYCGNPAEHADHLMPLARGGLHCRDNIVPACADCNEHKQARDPFEWLLSLQ